MSKKLFFSCSNCMSYGSYGGESYCQNCNSNISEEDIHWVCPSCGSHVDKNEKKCWKCESSSSNKTKWWGW